MRKKPEVKETDSVRRFLTSLTEAKTKIEAAQREYVKEATLGFKPFLQDLFDQYPALNGLEIRGWTMGFNDGEECYHQQRTFITRNQFNYYGYYEDDEELPFDNSGITENKADEIAKGIDSLEDALESIYGTNWKLTVTRGRNGKIDVEQNKYNCGY